MRREERIIFFIGFGVVALFPIGLVVTWLAANPDLTQLQIVLRAKDQALLNAMMLRDRSIWEKEVAPDAVYVDENGHVLHGVEIPSKLLRLRPRHASGSIRIVSYEVHRTGDVATVVHRDEEQLLIHGIPLRAEYLTTETWVRPAFAWKLLLVHVHVIDRKPKTLSSRLPRAVSNRADVLLTLPSRVELQIANIQLQARGKDLRTAEMPRPCPRACHRRSLLSEGIG